MEHRRETRGRKSPKNRVREYGQYERQSHLNTSSPTQHSHIGGFTNPKKALERLAFEKLFPNQSLPSELMERTSYEDGMFDKIKHTIQDPLGRKKAAIEAETRARYLREEASKKADEKAAASIKLKATLGADTKHKEAMRKEEDSTGIRWEGGHRRSPSSALASRRMNGKC